MLKDMNLNKKVLCYINLEKLIGNSIKYIQYSFMNINKKQLKYFTLYKFKP